MNMHSTHSRHQRNRRPDPLGFFGYCLIGALACGLFAYSVLRMFGVVQ